MSLITQKQQIIKPQIINKKINSSDLVCSSYIDFSNPTFIDIDGMYFGSILVINYQREMEGLFIDRIMSLDLNIQVSIYYTKANTGDVIKELTYSIGNSGATIKTSNENQQDIELMGSSHDDAKNIRRKLQLGDENLFYLAIYIGMFAKSKEELERGLQKIESVAISSGLTTIRANYREEESFYSMLPFLSSNIDIDNIISKNVLTSGLVATYPFVSNELFDPNGILLGTNSFDNSIIMFDRFDSSKYKNANMFVIGTSGSGKSYFVKLMINRNRFLDISQFVIDPDREYRPICEKLRGTLINFGSSQVINIFDIRNTSLDEGESYLQNKLIRLNIFFSMIFEKITDEEKSLLEQAIIKIYKNKGITEDNESLYVDDKASIILSKKMFRTSEMMPRFEDLYNEIKKDKKLKKYATLLTPYVKGSLKYLNNFTNINIDNKLIVADVHDIPEENLPIIMYIITDFFWDAIKENRSKKKILYLDEVWKLINKNEYTADFVFKLFKTIRKFGGAATAITQDISDFFMLEDGKYGKGIINNSSCKCIFQLEENDINLLEKAISISDEEKYRLLNLKRGTAIIHAGRDAIMIDVISSKKEHSYINTDGELKAKEGDKNEKNNYSTWK